MINSLDITFFSLFAGSALLTVKAIQIFRSPVAQSRPILRRRPEHILAQSFSHTNRTASTFDVWLTRVLSRAGLRIDRVTAVILIVAVALTSVGVAFVFELHVLFQLALGSTVFVFGFLVYYILMLLRIRAFNLQFSTSLELFARATRAGENLESAFRIASQSSKEPLRGEFAQCVKQLQMGLSPTRVTRELAERTGLADVFLFAHTIAMHQTVGGKLANSLEKLSTVVRDRSECEKKLKSVTSIGRSAVFSIIGIGIFGLSYMVMNQPEYIGKLSESELGNKIIIYAVISEFVGLIWVGWTLKSDL